MQVFTPKQRQIIAESDLDRRLISRDHSIVADQDDPIPKEDEEQQLEESWKGAIGKRHE